MVITPQTEIRLLQCPLEADNLHQIKFSNATAQYNYFHGLTSLSIDNCTYARENGTLRVPISYDTAIRYNYVMYQNESYSNKWFYAFITNYTYVNNDMTAIEIKTDVYQTWQFNFTWKQSFIEREHVNNDTLGLHTIPENLETGDYKVYFQDKDSTTLPDCIIMGCTIDLATSSQQTIYRYSGCYNGLVSGCGYYRFDNFSQLISALNSITGMGQQESIVTMFMYPSAMAPLMSGSNNKVDTSGSPITKNYGISRIASLDGYTPKNKKLLTYPYCYIRLSNGIGTSGIYRQEVWSLNSNNEMVVHADSVLCPGGSVRIYPVNYNGSEHNYDEGFSLGKYPQLSWSVDLYTNWEVQNGVNIFGTPLTATEFGVYGGLTKSLLNATSGNLTEATGQLGNVFGAMNEQYRHAMVPPTIGGNLNSGDVSAIAGYSAFQFQRCGIKREYAEIIDDYLSMFGYKVNRVGIPLEHSRQNWNYIKTNGANIEGDDIPQVAINELKQMFDNGVTLWHSASNIYNYSLSNNII